jgi:hypothetical protein
MPDPTHYTYRVAWSVEDGEHVATVAEFPSLSWLAPTLPLPWSKRSQASPMSYATCSPTWPHPANRFPRPCRNAPTPGGSWCASRRRFTVALSVKPPNST